VDISGHFATTGIDRHPVFLSLVFHIQEQEEYGKVENIPIFYNSVKLSTFLE
jgi:hypothetical protein